MELYDEENCIAFIEGKNTCWFSNLSLPKTDRNYYIKTYFNIRDWPECKFQSDETKDIFWYLKI
jgi:hypothetical protein